jgi:hypothetical protein
VELQVPRPDNGVESVGERFEAWDVTPRCSVLQVILTSVSHLRCMSHIITILNVVPQVEVGTEVVMEVTSS